MTYEDLFSMMRKHGADLTVEGDLRWTAAGFFAFMRDALRQNNDKLDYRARPLLSEVAAKAVASRDVPMAIRAGLAPALAIDAALSPRPFVAQVAPASQPRKPRSDFGKTHKKRARRK